MLSLVPQIFPVKKKITDFIRKIKELPTISNCDVSDFAAMGFSAIFICLSAMSFLLFLLATSLLCLV